MRMQKLPTQNMYATVSICVIHSDYIFMGTPMMEYDSHVNHLLFSRYPHDCYAIRAFGKRLNS